MFFSSKDETNTKAHQIPTYLRKEVSEVKREKNKEAVTLVAVFFLELLHASIWKKLLMEEILHRI